MREKSQGSDLWQLKTAPGGLIDVEFVTQQALLLRKSDALHPSTQDAIESLKAGGDMQRLMRLKNYRVLSEYFNVYNRFCGLQSVRISTLKPLQTGLKSRLARAIGATSFTEVSDRLRQAKQDAAEIRCKNIGELATD